MNWYLHGLIEWHHWLGIATTILLYLAGRGTLRSRSPSDNQGKGSDNEQGQ